MHNGSKVTFNSNNLGHWNGRKEYVVTHHLPGRSETIGLAFHTGFCWQLLHYRYKNLRELKDVIRHKYTGSKVKDS